jgi:hypothetical protein
MPARAELDRPQCGEELACSAAAVRVGDVALESVRGVPQRRSQLAQRRLGVVRADDRRKDRLDRRDGLAPCHGRIPAFAGVGGRPRLAKQFRGPIPRGRGPQVGAVDGLVDSPDEATVRVIDAVLVGDLPQQLLFEPLKVRLVGEGYHEVDDIEVELRVALHRVPQTPPARVGKTQAKLRLDQLRKLVLLVREVIFDPDVKPSLKAVPQVERHADGFAERFPLPHPHRQGNEPFAFLDTVFHARILPYADLALIVSITLDYAVEALRLAREETTA